MVDYYAVDFGSTFADGCCYYYTTGCCTTAGFGSGFAICGCYTGWATVFWKELFGFSCSTLVGWRVSWPSSISSFGFLSV